MRAAKGRVVMEHRLEHLRRAHARGERERRPRRGLHREPAHDLHTRGRRHHSCIKMEPEAPPAPADEADVLASLHEKVDELARTMFFSLNSIRRREGAGEGELGAEVAALSSSLAASSKEIDALIDRIPGLDRTAE